MGEHEQPPEGNPDWSGTGGEPPTVPLPAAPPDGWASEPTSAIAPPVSPPVAPPVEQWPATPVATDHSWAATPGYSPPTAPSPDPMQPAGTPPSAYPPAGYGAPGYGTPGYGSPGQGQPYVAAPVNPFQSRATTVLVLGIIGVTACQILAPVAWIQGNSLKNDAEAAGWPEPDVAKVGRILGIVGTALLGLVAAFFVVYLIIAVVAFGATASSV